MDSSRTGRCCRYHLDNAGNSPRRVYVLLRKIQKYLSNAVQTFTLWIYPPPSKLQPTIPAIKLHRGAICLVEEEQNGNTR